MKGDESTKAKVKTDIAKYFEMVRDHAKNKPDEPLDYEALKAFFIIDAN